jgi:pentatricopeptide repeat protein
VAGTKRAFGAVQVTYSTLIDGHVRAGQLEQALRLLREMGSHGLRPNIITYNTLLKGYCMTEPPSLAVRSSFAKEPCPSSWCILLLYCRTALLLATCLPSITWCTLAVQCCTALCRAMTGACTWRILALHCRTALCCAMTGTSTRCILTLYCHTAFQQQVQAVHGASRQGPA